MNKFAKLQEWLITICKRMTSVYLQKLKTTGDFYENTNKIQLGHRNEIWHRKMCYAQSEKWKTRKNEKNKSVKLRKNQNT